MDGKDSIRSTFAQLLGASFFDECDVEARLVEPCLRGLGWNLSGAKNQRTNIPSDKKTDLEPGIHDKGLYPECWWS